MASLLSGVQGALGTSVLLAAAAQPAAALYDKWRNYNYYSIIVDSAKTPEAFVWVLDYISSDVEFVKNNKRWTLATRVEGFGANQANSTVRVLGPGLPVE